MAAVLAVVQPGPSAAALAILGPEKVGRLELGPGERRARQRRRLRARAGFGAAVRTGSVRFGPSGPERSLGRGQTIKTAAARRPPPPPRKQRWQAPRRRWRRVRVLRRVGHLAGKLRRETRRDARILHVVKAWGVRPLGREGADSGCVQGQ
eukprot:362044-Chlamydomonas_euryale.AAC.6